MGELDTDLGDTSGEGVDSFALRAQNLLGGMKLEPQTLLSEIKSSRNLIGWLWLRFPSKKKDMGSLEEPWRAEEGELAWTDGQKCIPRVQEFCWGAGSWPRMVCCAPGTLGPCLCHVLRINGLHDSELKEKCEVHDGVPKTMARISNTEVGCKAPAGASRDHGYINNPANHSAL